MEPVESRKAVAGPSSRHESHGAGSLSDRRALPSGKAVVWGPAGLPAVFVSRLRCDSHL